VTQHSIDGIGEIQARVDEGSVEVENEESNLFYWNRPVGMNHYCHFIRQMVGR